MENHSRDTELLRYIRGEMEPGEQEDFEHAMDNEPGLKSEWHFQSTLFQGIQSEFVQRKKQLLKDYEARKAKRAKRRRLFKTMGAVAAILVGLVFLIQFLITDDKSPQQLASNAFQPFPNHLTTKTRGNTVSYGPLLNKAMMLYEKGNYQKSLQPFKEAVKEKEHPPLSRFYLANAYLAVDSQEKALAHFKAIQNNLKTQYKPHNRWYLSLSYLANGEPKKALPLLKTLANNNSHYRDRAHNLIQKIKDN